VTDDESGHNELEMACRNERSLIRMRLTHSLTAALDQLSVVASSTSSDLGSRSGQHQQTGQCLLPLVATMFFVVDMADASSQQQILLRSGKRGKLLPLGTRGAFPPIVRARHFLAIKLVFSRRKLALTLLCRTRCVLLYIKTPILEFKICLSLRSR